MAATKSIYIIRNCSNLLKISKNLKVNNLPLVTSFLCNNHSRHLKRNYCVVQRNELVVSPGKHLNNDSTALNADDLSVSTNNELEVNDLQNSLSTKLKIEDVSDYAPVLVPSYNLAAYVNDSPTLQEFVKLGVRLYKLEKEKGVAEFILKLNFDKDVKAYLTFLHDNGVKPDDLGEFITLNPLIFKEDLRNLQIRLNYLHSKRFTSEMIAEIITKNPKWLSFSTKEIDSRLGFFQQEFQLTGHEIRSIAVRLPKLITYDLNHVKINVFSFKEEMGFNEIELKKIFLKTPRLFFKTKRLTLEKFDYVHNIMKINHDLIVDQPNVLLSRLFRIKERHEFLKHLGRAQYNPKEPGYVALKTLVTGNDAEFCRDVAKTSIQTFNIFQKTL